MMIRRKNYNLTTDKNALAPTTSVEVVIVLILLLTAFASCLDMKIFQIYFYQNLGYLLNVFVIALCFGLYLVRRRIFQRKDILCIGFALFLIGYCILSAVVTAGGMRYAGTVFNTIILVIIFRNTQISYKAIRNTCLIIILIMLSIAVNVNGYYDRQFVEESVNSNYIAQLAVVGMIYVNYFLCFIKNNRLYSISALRILINILAFYILWECQSRGALLAVLFFVVMIYFFPKKWLEKKNLITLMSAAIAIFGILMTYLYLKIIVPRNLLFMGKRTNSRSRLWTYFWDNIGEDILKLFVGHGTNDVMREIFGYGFHNVYLGIWYDIGLIGLFLFIGFILWNLKETYKSNRKLTRFTIYAMIGFMSLQIADYFAVTFTGPLVIWNFTLLGFVVMFQKKRNNYFL